MSSSALFNKGGSLYDYLEKRKKNIVKNIEDYHPTYLKDMNVEHEYEIVLDKYIIEVPKLLVEYIYIKEPREVEIRDSKNVLYVTDRRPVYRRGLHLEIVIPFSGESLLFNYRPSTRKDSVPRGKIENDGVILEYDIIDEDRENFSYSKDLDALKEYLSFAEQDVNGFNTWVKKNLSDLLLRRKSQSEERNKFVDSLNISARAKVDTTPHYPPDTRATTCADALEEAVKHYGGVVSSRQIFDYIKRIYNDVWKDGTIRAHVMGCSVNHSSSHHYKYFRKFLFTIGRGQVRQYDPETDGEWEWTPTGMVRTSNIEGRNIALLIGVNHYLDDQIRNLEYCVSDVVDLDNILSDELRGNYTTRLLHSEMNDIRTVPNRSNIMSNIRLLSNNARRNDKILLYFAGHGTDENGENYLLPGDSRFNVLNETAIPISWIKDSLSSSLASKKYIIIDACHAGLRIGRELPSPMTESFHEAILAHAEGMAILCSCRMGEISHDWPDMNHGVFSYYLLEGLRGSADYDNDQIITVSDINRFVYTYVREWAYRNETEQNPTMLYEVSGEFIMVKVPTEEITDIDSPPVQVDEIPVSEPYDASDIDNVFNELKFMSNEDIINNKDLIHILDSLISEEDNIDRLLEKGRHFLISMFNTRFSSSLVRFYLMPLVVKITKYRDIKKWIKNEEAIIEYLILEFINSSSFDRAGTMAQIINDILPVISDENLLRIIDAIQTNEQISYSFKARKYLINIVDASKTIIDRESYSELMTLLS